MHANYFSGIIIFLNLTVYELLALPHPLLPTSRHETVVSIIQLQIWNQHHLVPYPTSNLYRDLGVFIEIFCCTTYYGQTHIRYCSQLFAPQRQKLIEHGLNSQMMLIAVISRRTCCQWKHVRRWWIQIECMFVMRNRWRVHSSVLLFYKYLWSK